MNIKIVTYGNFPYGGASANLLRYFSMALYQANNEVEVIIPTGYYFGKKVDVNKKRTGKIKGVKYIYTGFLFHPRNYLGKVIDNTIGPLMMFLLLLIKHFLILKVDVLIVYNTTFTRTLLILILRKLIKTKYIVILPEFYSKPKIKKYSLASFKWNNYIYGMKLIKSADGFIVASTYLKKYILKDLNKNASIFILPNAMDPSFFELNNIAPFKDGLITIGYVGTPTKKDGAKDLIKSFAKLKQKYQDIHLLIIGDITNGNSLVPDLEKLANKLGVRDSITFTGLISFSKVPDLLNSCQILALTRPSGRFAEAGFPTKLGEYFACRKPVVVTAVGDIRNYFEEGNQVIMVENIDSIVKGFERLLKNKELGKKISDNAYKWMDENLNYVSISNRINEFIKSI